jgi:hypothetical protein
MDRNVVADADDILPAGILDHEVLVGDPAGKRFRVDDTLPACEGGGDLAWIRLLGLVHLSLGATRASAGFMVFCELELFQLAMP